MRFIQGLIGISVGFLFIKYSFQLTEWLGHVDWAETYLKSGLGGTYTMYRLVGLIFIILSILYMFNALGAGPLEPLFGGLK